MAFPQHNPLKKKRRSRSEGVARDGSQRSSVYGEQSEKWRVKISRASVTVADRLRRMR